jgi:bacterioferritin-associated ferredoxin
MEIRCICHDISLSEIAAQSKKLGGISLEELQKQKICATKCKLCIPYIQAFLKKTS